MRIENLSEDNIRLLRDLIDYQLPVTVRTKGAT